MPHNQKGRGGGHPGEVELQGWLLGEHWRGGRGSRDFSQKDRTLEEAAVWATRTAGSFSWWSVNNPEELSTGQLAMA